MDRENCDVLVVGGGGAALRAAVEAKTANPTLRVILVTKGELGRSGVTATACSDRMAFHVSLPHTPPGGPDAWKLHADDIYRIGGYVSDENLAQILAKNGRAAFDFLDSLGVPFVRRKDGLPDQFVTDGSEYPRACYTGPRTANHIEEALVRKLRSMEIDVVEDHMVVDLILSEDGARAVGAFVLPTNGPPSGEDYGLRAFLSKAIVVATGGAGELFKVNVYPEGMTGDGYAFCYRAGAELVNMEFIQIGLSSVKTKLACSGSMMRALPRVVNGRGEEFLSHYFPEGTPLGEVYTILFRKGASWPVSYETPSKTIDIAAFREMASGEKVYLDYSRNPRGLNFDELDGSVIRWYRDVKGIDPRDPSVQNTPLARLKLINPDSVAWLKERGVDLERGDRIEVAPAVQHFQGGVKIGESGQTSIPGLYAAGECAGGQHGANRPGGNSLLDCQVFGQIAGRRAAEECADMEDPTGVPHSQEEAVLSRIRGLLGARAVPKAAAVRENIQKWMSEAAGVIRTEVGLKSGLQRLERLRGMGMRVDERGLAYALETLNLFDVGRMVLGAAARRTESRGPHLFFRDFDDPDPVERDDSQWRKYIVIRKSDSQMVFEAREPIRVS
ncbi:MAG: FAD-binding protein [bacterium]